ncbi:MAG: response regulator [Candidatus Omnitrophica bacterium]|nr:response regulator [Candidatus Omnitrophota bacterium]
MAFKVLVVDDEEDIRQIIAKRLNQEGFVVFTAGDGFEGLSLAKREIPSLILLDVVMPYCDGFTMLKELQKDEVLRQIPVIMVTAKGHTESIFEGQRLGVTDYIVKPIDFQQLLHYIRKYLY